MRREGEENEEREEEGGVTERDRCLQDECVSRDGLRGEEEERERFDTRCFSQFWQHPFTN